MIRTILLMASAAWLAAPAYALSPGGVVDNFRLVDHTGKSHELYGLSNSKAVVIMIQGNGCPIARHAVHTLREVRDKYQSEGVEFLMLNSNLQDDRESVAKEASEFGIDFPILLDRDQAIGEALGVVRTAEIFLIEPKSWKLVYRGPIDDRLHYERQRPARNHYLVDALDDVLAGRAVRVPQKEGVGCLVNFPNRGRQAHAH
jgi:peroxiredoxin